MEERNKNIIVLSGKKQSGKNTVASMINNYLLNKHISKGIPYLPTDLFYKEMSFAQPIKDILSIVAREPVDKLDEYKEVSFFDRKDSNLFTQKTPRDFYKLIADFFKKNITDYVWIDILFSKLNKDSKVIITDMRFKEEFDVLLESKLNPIFIRIKRKARHDPSKSEVDLDDIPDSSFDYIIENDSDEKSLYNKVELFCQKFKI